MDRALRNLVNAPDEFDQDACNEAKTQCDMCVSKMKQKDNKDAVWKLPAFQAHEHSAWDCLFRNCSHSLFNPKGVPLDCVIWQDTNAHAF